MHSATKMITWEDQTLVTRIFYLNMQHNLCAYNHDTYVQFHDRSMTCNKFISGSFCCNEIFLLIYDIRHIGTETRKRFVIFGHSTRSLIGYANVKCAFHMICWVCFKIPYTFLEAFTIWVSIKSHQQIYHLYFISRHALITKHQTIFWDGVCSEKKKFKMKSGTNLVFWLLICMLATI